MIKLNPGLSTAIPANLVVSEPPLIYNVGNPFVVEPVVALIVK